MKKLIIVLLSVLSISISQVFSDYSYVGVESSAMAGTISPNISSDNGLFQNPASLAGLNDNIVIAGQSNLFNQSAFPYQHLGLVYDIPVVGQLGISYQSFSTEYNGIKLSSENVLSISKGTFIQKDRNSCSAIGYRINFLSWEQAASAGTTGDGSNGLDSHQSSTVGLDFGIVGGLRDRYWVGGYLTNINSPMINGQNLPRSISLSLGFNPSKKIQTSLSMERLLGRNDRQVKLGLQYKLNSSLSIISGVQSNPNRLGLGVEYEILNRFTLGYSILTHHVMSETHNFEIKIK
tara:strand:- start:500 stop:1375 length:876 start_codon:yes stop_codon:yes gene_type:complete